jgi:hypothetical protein
MSESMRARLLCGSVGSLLGVGVGFVFFVITQPPRGPFPLFMPAVFAAVFATVGFIAVEKLFPILLEIVVGFLALGGGAYLWYHFTG